MCIGGSQQRLSHHKHPGARDDGEGNRGKSGMADLAREGVKARENTGEAVGHSKNAGLEFKHSKVFSAFEGHINFRE